MGSEYLEHVDSCIRHWRAKLAAASTVAARQMAAGLPGDVEVGYVATGSEGEVIAYPKGAGDPASGAMVGKLPEEAVPMLRTSFQTVKDWPATPVVGEKPNH